MVDKSNIHIAGTKIVIGENIKLLRQQTGLSVEKLAEKVGLSSTTITSYEKGLTSPSIETLCTLSVLFNVRVEAFLYDVLKETPVPNRVDIVTTVNVLNNNLKNNVVTYNNKPLNINQKKGICLAIESIKLSLNYFK